jgi:hypothetical protein
MYVHVRQHPSVSWWVRRNEINTIPLVALAGVETEATISPWTAVAHRHPNLGDSVHSHTLPSLQVYLGKRPVDFGTEFRAKEND